MRSLSILGGLASVGMLAACAWQIAGRCAAVIAGFIGATSAHQVFYSTQMRAYIFAELAFTVSLLGLLLLSRQDRTKRQCLIAAAIYALGAATAIYCHTTMILWPIAATGAALAMLAFRQWNRARFIHLVAADVAVAAIASWWLYITALQIGAGAKGVSWIPDVPLTGYISLLRQSIFLISSNNPLFKILSYAVIVLALSALVGKDRKVIYLLAALLLSSTAVLFIANQFKPIILGRTLFWMSGLVVLLVSAALAELRPVWLRRLAVTVVCCLLALDLSQVRGSFQTEDWQGYLRFQASVPQATILVDGAANGIAARRACATELAAACPLRFAAIAKAASSGDAGGAAILNLRPGAHIPVSGQAYLLDTAGGSASSHFALPPATPSRTFAGLTLRGPVSAAELVAK